MKRILTLCLLLLPAWLSAQSIAPMLIGSCGQVFTGSTIILEWSAGETAVSSFIAPSSLLTEGFHQPNLIVTAVTESQAILMEVWPNPVAEILYLRFTQGSSEPLRVDLYNPLGQCVLHNVWSETSSELQISLVHLSAGAYTLVVGGNSMTQTLSWNILKLAY